MSAKRADRSRLMDGRLVVVLAFAQVWTLAACNALKEDAVPERGQDGSDGAPPHDGDRDEIDVVDLTDRPVTDRGSDEFLDDADACTPSCSHLGDVRCGAPEEASTSQQIQICWRVGGCLRWLDSTTCDTTETCCDGACRSRDETTCETMPPTGFDLYVDARTGSDDADAGLERGTPGRPFRTISKAIRAAQSSQGAKHIYIAAGRYDAALGETFPLILRGGLSLHGEGATIVTVQGSGDFDHSAAGGSFNGKYRVTVVVGDDTAETSVQGMTLLADSPIPASSRVGVLCDRGSAPSFASGVTTLDQVTVGPGYDNGIVATTTNAPDSSGCSLRLTKSTVLGSSWGVVSFGCGTAVGRVPVSVQIGGPGMGNSFAWNNTPSELGGSILIWPCTTNSTIIANSFRDGGTGVSVDQSSEQGVNINHITINGNTFSGMSINGLAVSGNAVVIDELNDNSFTNVSGSLGIDRTRVAAALAIIGSGGAVPSIKKARRNTMIGNDCGLILGGFDNVSFGASGPIDFGQASDPGLNTLRCNSSPTGLGGFDLSMTGSGAGVIPFEGNSWDHFPPPTSVSGSAPNGVDIVSDSPVPGLDLALGTASSAPCPNGRVGGP